MDQHPPSPHLSKKFTITESQERAVCILSLHGVLDNTTSRDLKEKIGSLLASGITRMVIDLSGLQYLASAGLGVLIAGQHDAEQAGGSMQFANPSVPVREICTMLGLFTIIQVHERLDQGMLAAESGSPR